MVSDKQMPLVSVGIPVHNGAKTLRRALDSILLQDYTNLEIIISDNASIDETPDICREYAARDRRIFYYRMEKNVGATENFNYVIKSSKGKYFMRMSHDDVRGLAYISRCVALLEANAQSVLCHSHTAAFYGDITNVLAIITHDSMEGIHCPVKRFVAALEHLPGSAIDGVIRAETLKTKIRPMENYMSSDIVMMCELSLYGEFIQVPDVLFWRSGKTILPSPKEIYAVYGIGKKQLRLRSPFLLVALNHAKSINRAPLSIVAKAYLLISLVWHELKIIAAKMLFRAGTTLMGANCPGFLVKIAVSVVNNDPNIRRLKPFYELPPTLQPVWKLLNHRNFERAISLQRLLIEKYFQETHSLAKETRSIECK